jgi:hypothetical protein
MMTERQKEGSLECHNSNHPWNFFFVASARVLYMPMCNLHNSFVDSTSVVIAARIGFMDAVWVFYSQKLITLMNTSVQIASVIPILILPT